MKANILIVDDCPVMRMIIKRTIKICGLDTDEVIEAGDGKEGLEWMKAVHFDLVIADLNMPEMTGSEMIANIRVSSSNDSVPILAVSAESNDTRIDVISGLVEGFVHKPFSVENLRDQILKILNKRTITEEKSKMTDN